MMLDSWCESAVKHKGEAGISKSRWTIAPSPMRDGTAEGRKEKSKLTIHSNSTDDTLTQVLLETR